MKFFKNIFFPPKKIAICSGYFRPPHVGHLMYLNAAKSKNNELIVIVNNDLQVKKKGTVPFYDEHHTAIIIGNLKSVDMVWIASDTEKDVCKTLTRIREEYPNDILTFYNSGDRNVKNIESKEVQLCEKLGINYEIISLPKVASSSKLIEDACAYF